MSLPGPMRWIGVTTVGYALGMTVSVTLLGAIARPIGPFLSGMSFVALFGAVVGVGLGAVQFVAIPRGAVRPHVWILATLLGGAVGFAGAAVVGEFLANQISPTTNIVIGGGTIQITSGAIFGLGIGVAQWRVLRRDRVMGRGWIVASMVGAGLGYGAAAAALDLLEVPILKANLIPSFGAIVGILAGLAQGLFLWSRQRAH